MHLEEWEVLDLLTALVDKSLVIYEEDENGVGRYRMMETIRQYARDRLLESDEGREVRDRHRDFFSALVVESEPHWAGPQQALWLQRLETEHDNLWAALEWCLFDEDSAEKGLQMAGAMWRYWTIRGYLSEGREILSALLTRGEASNPSEARAKCLGAAGILAWSQGDYAAACALHEESLAIHRALGDKPGIAAALNGLANATYYSGDFAAARSLYEESLTLNRELGNQKGTATALANLGLVYSDEGNFTAARPLLEESLRLKRELGDQHGIAHSFNQLGELSYREGDYATARARFEEGSRRFQALGDKGGMAMSLIYLGGIAREQGDAARAWAQLTEALDIIRNIGAKWETIVCLEEMGKVAVVENQPERAARLWGAAEKLRGGIHSAWTPVVRAALEKAMASARRAMGEEAFAAAWATGREMTMEEAIEFALRETQ
jgi:tetratricopeptide (TPR) repeat protein